MISHIFLKKSDFFKEYPAMIINTNVKDLIKTSCIFFPPLRYYIINHLFIRMKSKFENNFLLKVLML